MKITIYELLGMIKDGKAPKRIRFLNHYYMWKENDEDYQKEDGLMLFGNIKINYILNSEVEIIEENKIPEKLEIKIQNETTGNAYITNAQGTKCYLTKHSKMIAEKINEIIDYLKRKGGINNGKD